MSLLSYLRDSAGAVVVESANRRLRLLPEEHFQDAIVRERKRAVRSGKALLLLLVSGPFREPGMEDAVTRVLAASTRETDFAGWYGQQTQAGALFADLACDDPAIIEPMVIRLRENLVNQVGAVQARRFAVDWHVFAGQAPSDWDGSDASAAFYPDQQQNIWQRTKKGDLLKRAIDIVGSAAAIILLVPLFLVLGGLVKATSAGPALFRQQRIGRDGRPFTFLKFRSMRVNTDDAIHRQYVERFIAQDRAAEQAGSGRPVFKIKNDPRVTPVGRFLRRTSLDELPQFINVLLGDMSLVGPRPPLPYEYRSYSAWHRRRVTEAKPGLTGLWQVTGRSRTTFSDMVRLDLRYVQNRSLRMDLAILLLTPLVVMGGDGAH